MKFVILSFVVAFLVALTVAAAPLKSVIVSYPKDTPDSAVDQAKKTITDAGGSISHEYKLVFKGFAANVPASTLEEVQTSGSKYNALIEEDSEVQAWNGNN